jgi:hypothetical protein
LLFPLPAAAVQPQPCPPPPLPPGKPPPPRPKPKVAESKLPKPLPVAQRHVNLSAVRGKGMWVTTWPDSTTDLAKVVRTARAAGLRQLWVRTGGYKQGYYGDRVLSRLLPLAHANGLAVVAWDFPNFSDPMVDARRARAALTGVFGGHRLDAFSPDIETSAEGVYVTTRRIQLYLSLVRSYAGSRPVVATVPRPTPLRLRTYPYAAQKPYVDVFAPMVYWSCKEPGTLVKESFRALAKMRPLHLIGQSYDMADEGGRHGLPSAREIWRFLDASHRYGGLGASLYTYETTRDQQWLALGRYPWKVRG